MTQRFITITRYDICEGENVVAHRSVICENDKRVLPQESIFGEAIRFSDKARFELERKPA